MKSSIGFLVCANVLSGCRAETGFVNLQYAFETVL